MPKTRQSILSACFLQPEKWWYLSSLARHLGVSPSSLQRELASLVANDLLLTRPDGNRIYYRANQECPIYHELWTVLVKTTGLADILSSFLHKHFADIDFAFIFGSTARGEIRALSDVDLFLVGDVKMIALAPSLKSAEAALGREVNVTHFGRNEFFDKLKGGNAFLKTALLDKKIFLKGTERELKAVAR